MRFWYDYSIELLKRDMRFNDREEDGFLTLQRELT